MTTPTQGEHAQKALAHELFAAAQLAPGEGIEDAVRRIAAALTAPTAQPAAPQGVVYAELPAMPPTDDRKPYDPDQPDGYLESDNDWIDRNLEAVRWLADNHAAIRTSNGQAPAGAVLFDEQGFREWVLRNLPDDTIIGNGAWWADHLTAWAKRFVKAAPTAQAAPAAGAVAGPDEAGKLGRPCKVGGPCVASATSACACSELVDTASNNAAAPTTAAQADSVLEDAALSTDDAALLEKAIADFEECGETDVPDADLRRFAAAGYLECVHYHVMPAAQEAIDAARKQGGTHD